MMALWRWLTGRLSVTEGIEKWRAFYGYDNESGEHINSVTALKLSAWWSSVRLITETIATLPVNIFQKKGEDRDVLPGYFLYNLLHDSPNSEQTPVEWWEGRIGPLCMVGNSFAEKKFLGEKLVSLLPMPVEYVSVERRKSDNALIYKFTDRGKLVELPSNKVFHIKGFAPNDEDLGLSPVEYAARSLGGSLALERSSARVYSRGMRATGFFSPPVDMTPEQRTEFIKNFINPAEGVKGEGKTLIFPPGFDWKPMTITPKDAEMALTRAGNVEEVCRWMRVPPILIGHASAGQTMWGSGVEQIILGWLVLGLRAYLRRIESAVNTRLIPLADRLNGISFEFNFEGLLRADSAARAALMSTLAQNGLRTRNELRRIDHWKAVPGADKLTVQSNLVPIDKLGEQQPSNPQSMDADGTREAIKLWIAQEKRNAA